MMGGKFNPPFGRRRNSDPKVTLMRRADTERDSRGFSITGERKRDTFGTDKPVTLPRVKFLDGTDDDKGSAA